MKGTTIDASAESLKRIGIPSFYLALENPDDYFKDVANLGLLLGNSKRADEIIAFYKTRLDRLRRVTATLKEKDKPRVLLLEYSDRGGQNAVQVPAKSWMQTIEVQTAGGNPVWFEATQISDGYTVVNFEQIAKWNPDKIFIIVWYTLDPKKVIRDLKSDPKWSALKAVRANEMYAFPCDVFNWDTPEMRWILGMDWLATRIHPDKFKDIAMEKEIISFFSKLFGMSETAIRAGILPKVQMDVR
jgi:iron complex transport system substrate-binding protein